jgi:hypothetical protein
MVWRYFDRKIQFSKRSELLTWTEIIALPFKFSSPYRIAAFFIKKGFETKLLMKQETINVDKPLLECCQVDAVERELFLDFFKAHNTILKRRIARAIMDKRPTLSNIIKALSTKSPVIALVDSYYTTKSRGAKNPPHLPHWIVVTGYENGRFHINDSASESGLKTGKMMIEGSVLERAMDTYPRFGWPSALIVAGLKARESDGQEEEFRKLLEER